MTLPGQGTAFTVEEHPTREAWLEARRTAITGSDAAALWTDEIAERGGRGISPLAVFARKVAGEDDSDALNLEIGRAIEPTIRSRYEREARKAVAYPGPFVLLRSLAHPHLAVSLDGAILDFETREPAAFEAKFWTGGASKWADGIPLDVEAQTRHAMIVTGWPVTVIAAIIVGRWTVRHVPRDLDFDRVHLARASDLWARIESREEPDATGYDGDALSRLHPTGDGTVELDAQAMIHAHALQLAKADEKAAHTAAEYHAARLKQAIGDAERGVLPDGSEYTYKLQRRTGYVVEATEFRVLRKKGERT